MRILFRSCKLTLANINKLGLNLLIVTMLLTTTSISYAAQTITIGRNAGVVWEGLPYNISMSGNMGDAGLNNVAGILAISSESNACMSTMLNSNLTTISGYQVLKIANGLGLAPRATGTANYYARDASGNLFLEQMVATLGLPETKARISGGLTNATITPPTNTPFGAVWWCLPPRQSNQNNFYSTTSSRNAYIKGSWVLIADGTQKNQTIKLAPMYAASLSNNPQYSKYVNILPSDISLRVSTLYCSVNTTTSVDFGTVSRDTRPNAELAVVTAPLNVFCEQSTSSGINANINIQFRAAVDNFDESTPTRLPMLTSTGAYITGSLSQTGNGECGIDDGIKFNSTPINLTSITSTQPAVQYTSVIAWRLCSAGATLPTGRVTSQAEMIVTFN